MTHARGTSGHRRLRAATGGSWVGADKMVSARITGDLAVLWDPTLTWAHAPVTPAHAGPLTGASPTTTSLRIARLKP
ncbi:hypothetical protein ABT187_02985 [Streptomyces sp. NPDC001817]|uniref:hypothetical protein n=1 Tax=Streptomyces sp. NPDC001817 TaxID=3154398 RepID=UPI00331FE1A8